MSIDRGLADRAEHIRRYREQLLTWDKYLPETQRRLKNRVFDTFDALIRHRGGHGLVAGLRLLDLGAADGALVQVCLERGVQASGLDISDGLDFEHDPLPLADGTVDVVTAVSLIEHLHSPANMLRETLRVLRPGGWFLLVTPNWRYARAEFYDDPTHVHPYSDVSLDRVLRGYGFADPYVVPWIVKKPAWMWDVPYPFFVARWLIPFRGTAPRWIPAILKGKSGTLLAAARKPHS